MVSQPKWGGLSTGTLTRRVLLSALAAPALDGCAAPLPPMDDPGSTAAARALLLDSAAAHGGAALAGVGDISVAYAGQWRALVGRLQPDLVDAGFRGASEERLLLGAGLSAQAYTGPQGTKFVARRHGPPGEGSVAVWRNGVAASDPAARDAAALVADGYRLFLLGPMLLAPRADLRLELAAPQRLVQEGVERPCDVIRLRLDPGLGLSATDGLALYIDQAEQLMRRVRFTLDGLESTRGAVAEVDCFDHVALGGVRWPTRFYEHLVRPLPLPVHDWRLTGLDLNRGLAPAELAGPTLTGRAATPATPLA